MGSILIYNISFHNPFATTYVADSLVVDSMYEHAEEFIKFFLNTVLSHQV